MEVEPDSEILTYSLKELNINWKYNVIVFLIGLLGIAQTILQMVFTVNSNNVIYLFACVWFGPCQLLATFLVLCINFASSIELRNHFATWATRFVTLGFIPFVNSVALNCLYIFDCYKADNTDEDNMEFDYCSFINYNITILVLNSISVILNFVFCIPYNTN